MFPVVARSIVRNVITPNAADVFIFSWDPGLADMYNVTYKPVSARYEPNAPLQPRFEELCRRSRGPCLWQALSWAYALAEGFELMRTHERRRGKEYDLVVFYRPDSVLLKPLDADMIVADPGVVYFTMWVGDDGCGDHHHVMTRAAATGFAGMFSAAEKAFSRESDGCPVPVGCLRDELCGNQILRRVRAESSCRPPRHRRDTCSTAWGCRFSPARTSQDGRVIAAK